MCTKPVIVIVAITFLMPSILSGSDISDLESHVWRGEYAKIVSDLHHVGDSEKAAYLIMAGDIQEASRMLTDPGDDFRAAILAYKESDWESVVALTATPVPKMWLEVYRLVIRTDALVQAGKSEAAIEVLENILKITETDPEIRNHHLFSKAMNLMVEAGTQKTGWLLKIDDNRIEKELLNARSLLTLSRMFFITGDAVKAKSLLLPAANLKLDEESIQIFDEVIGHAFPRLGIMSEKEVIHLTQVAVDHARKKTASKLLEHLVFRGVDSYQVAFFEACLLQKTGQSRTAEKVFRKLFRSQAPVRIKKESLIRIASIDYRNKRYASSAENFRLFGMFYPDDTRSERMLDNSARIRVTRKEWKKAIDTWDEIRKRVPQTKTGLNAVLSEAVLYHWLGKDLSANRILLELLPVTGRKLKPSVLYWLATTASSKDKPRWQKELQTRFPYSFYSKAFKKEEIFLSVGDNYLDAPGILKLMETRELMHYEAANKLYNEGKTSMVRHPAWEAFQYFLDSGMLDEAEKCATTLARLFHNDEEGLWMLYSHSRRLGMVNFSLDILGSHPVMWRNGQVPVNLRFPVPFLGIVMENLKKQHIPFELLFGVIREESYFDRNAISSAGACGLMQLMPSTG